MPALYLRPLTLWIRGGCQPEFTDAVALLFVIANFSECDPLPVLGGNPLGVTLFEIWPMKESSGGWAWVSSLCAVQARMQPWTLCNAVSAAKLATLCAWQQAALCCAAALYFASGTAS